MTGVTAQPMDHYPPPWSPDPVRQKLANYTIEDILDLPRESPRVELVDGRMLPSPSPQLLHQNIAFLLCAWLRTHAPADRYRAAFAVGVAIALNRSREPDVLLLDASVDQHQHFFAPDQVALVVEIVSPGTKRDDRITKPAEYAAAGIRHYWRVEPDPLHVYAYRLGVTGHYDLVADSAELLEVDEPFPIKLPISEITP